MDETFSLGANIVPQEMSFNASEWFRFFYYFYHYSYYLYYYYSFKLLYSISLFNYFLKKLIIQIYLDVSYRYKLELFVQSLTKVLLFFFSVLYALTFQSTSLIRIILLCGLFPALLGSFTELIISFIISCRWPSGSRAQCCRHPPALAPMPTRKLNPASSPPPLMIQLWLPLPRSRPF
jgi:hypothetical protein